MVEHGRMKGQARRKWRKIERNEECLYYLLILNLTIIIGFFIYLNKNKIKCNKKKRNFFKI